MASFVLPGCPEYYEKRYRILMVLFKQDATLGTITHTGIIEGTREYGDYLYSQGVAILQFTAIQKP